jgi:fibronectin-binding autotransporter adhesin
VKLNFKRALGATTALVTCLAGVHDAAAHTDSLGFVISGGSASGTYNVNIFYGSWHSSVPGPEGALDLWNSSGALVGTVNFALAPGFNGVANGTLPAGLTPGENYFFPDYMGGLNGDVSGHAIFAFQFVTFLDLTPGSYTFGYNAGSSFTVNWDPSDPMINAGAFTIGPNGQIVIVGAGPPTIDLSQSFFTSDAFSGGQDMTFDGGTLQLLVGSENLSSNATVNATGGVVDTNALSGALSGNFSGSGVIQVIGGGTLAVSGANSHGGFLVNHSTLSAGDDSALGAAGAILTLNHGTFAPIQSMSIDRDIAMTSSHGGAFDVADALTLTINGELSGDGCLYKRGLGSMDLRADGSNSIGACVEQGLMAFNAVFTGDVWVEAAGRISGGGAIIGDVEVSGVLSPGNSPGQMTVVGSVTQLPGSTLEIDVDGPTAGTGAGHFDTLVLLGSSSIFTADGTLAPILRGISGPANNTYTPSIGDTFEIVSAEGGVAGAFDSITQPGGGLPANARFDVLYLDHSVVLAVTANNYALALADLGRRNAISAATALEAIRPSAGAAATTPADDLFAGLVGYNEQDLAQVFQQISGDIHAAQLAAGHRANGLTRRAIRDRFAAGETDRRVWGQVLGARAQTDADSFANELDGRINGAIVGFDNAVRPNLMLGVAGAIMQSEVRGDGSAEAHSYQAMAYGRWTGPAIFVDAHVLYGYDRYKTERSVALSSGTEALASRTHGETFAADFSAGHRFSIGGEAALDAIAGVSWDLVSRDDVSERGDASVALTFDEEESESLRARLGARYSGELTISGAVFRPYLEAYAVHEFADTASTVHASLGGVSFDASSPDMGEDSAQLGAGFNATLNSEAELFLGYHGEFSEAHEDQAVQLGVRASW